MFFMQSRDLAIILYPKVKISSIGIGKCNHCIDNFLIRQLLSITFELMRHIFPKTNVQCNHIL